MTWVKLSDVFPEDPKIEGLSDKAFRLYVTALCYCARNLTDGEITETALKTIAASAGLSRKTQKVAQTELLRAHLWATENGPIVIQKYLIYNPSAEHVRAERDKAKSRMQRLRSGEQKPNRSGEQNANKEAMFGDPDPTRTKGPPVAMSPTVTDTPEPVGGGFEPEHPENPSPELGAMLETTLRKMPA